ncbi:TetR family transcriptional regulator C-terminal domain-containing protein [Marinobacteraceae bacterium S3BR75-40.1]
MARPRRSQQTREDLLREGVELLSEQGYHGTGLKEILDRVKAPKGSFYNYFESKEAYTAELIEHYTDHLLGLMDRYLEQAPDDPPTVIRNIYGLMIGEFEAHDCTQGCLLGNLAAEISAHHPRCQAALRRAFHAWEQRFVPLLERGQAKGQFRSDIPAGALAGLFWNAWEGGILRMKMEGSTQSLRATVDLLLDGVLAAPV